MPRWSLLLLSDMEALCVRLLANVFSFSFLSTSAKDEWKLVCGLLTELSTVLSPVQANETKMFSVDEKRTVLVLLKLFLFLLADAELSGYAYQWRTLAQKHV